MYNKTSVNTLWVAWVSVAGRNISFIGSTFTSDNYHNIMFHSNLKNVLKCSSTMYHMVWSFEWTTIDKDMAWQNDWVLYVILYNDAMKRLRHD